MVERPAFYGSQPNIAQKLNASPLSATNSPKITPKLTKTQSFKHQKSEGFTPKLFRKLSFTKRNREGTPKMSKKLSLQNDSIDENRILQDVNRNARLEKQSFIVGYWECFKRIRNSSRNRQNRIVM